MFGKSKVNSTSPKPSLSREEIPESYSQVVSRVFNVWRADLLPVGGILLKVEDLNNLMPSPQSMIPGNLVRLPVVVYRVSETTFNIFNSDLRLVGGIKILGYHDGCVELDLFGTEIHWTTRRSGFTHSAFMALGVNDAEFMANFNRNFASCEKFV